MSLDNERLASRVRVTHTDVSGTPALLQKLFDHAQRYPIAIGNLLPGSFQNYRRGPQSVL